MASNNERSLSKQKARLKQLFFEALKDIALTEYHPNPKIFFEGELALRAERSWLSGEIISYKAISVTDLVEYFKDCEYHNRESELKLN